jgi:hypothetical protein
MAFFRRKKPAVAPTAEHAVIAHFTLSWEEFGTNEEREAVFALEDRLIEAITDADVGEFDGNDFGAGEAVLYAYGPDADRLFDAMEPHLQAFEARPAFCILRYGEASDPAAHERRIDL